MAVQQSFIGQDVNPIVQGRLEQAMSANALARKLGLSRQYISRAEQGTYSSLNPALIKWTARVLDVDVRWVSRSYENFQKAQRRATLQKLTPAPLERSANDKTPGGALFGKWRSDYWNSSTAFAVDFCVHPDLVTKYEEGIQDNMPKQIKNALVENGIMSETWIERP